MDPAIEREIDLGGRPQRIAIGAGARRELVDLVRGRPVAIVTDENVAGPWAMPLAAEIARGADVEPVVIELEPGERTKSLAEVETIARALVEAEVGRDGVIVAVGGGVVSDIAGFVASIHRRGVEWICVPTSVVGQVDAAVGGKTGVDVGVAKNAAGTFHPARHVLIDPATLDTLDDREWRAGLAEVWKHALIADASLFEELEDRGELRGFSTELLGRIVSVKTTLCERDPFDRDIRARLNFGHTIGHALESEMLRRDSPWRHGECVAVGMVIAAEISAADGRIDAAVIARIDRALTTSGLPVQLPIGVSFEDLRRHLGQDKKAERNSLRWVLLDSIGAASQGHSVREEIVREAVSRRTAPGERS